jgi:hypothetical protein
MNSQLVVTRYFHTSLPRKCLTSVSISCVLFVRYCAVFKVQVDTFASAEYLHNPEVFLSGPAMGDGLSAMSSAALRSPAQPIAPGLLPIA